MKIQYLLYIFLLMSLRWTYAQPYFQQQVNYTIQVTLDDSKNVLHGTIQMEYINNSPDSMHKIYLHLWPNAYKNNNTALAQQLYRSGQLNLYYADDNDRGYIDSLDFKVDNVKVTWMYDPEHIDIGIILLNSALAPGGKIAISTPFYVKIPKGVFSRLGHIGQQYQITQWYPKPAVYDRYGWHPMPYLNQGEFYSEFGSYDVYITLPKNYVVGATGDLSGVRYSNNPGIDSREEEEIWLNAKELYTKDYLKSKRGGTDLFSKKKMFDISMSGLGMKDVDESEMVFPVSDTLRKTLHFHQEKVHDFAWFADKRYFVLSGEVKLPHSGRTVKTWSLFTDDYSEYWQHSVRYINDAIWYYSLWNGDYPYNHATAVDGALSAGGGMEYPNITIIGAMTDTFSLETVIMHEVGHNWFYGILGSNERDHAWMDEGLNSFNELRYKYTKYPGKKLFGGNKRVQKLLKRLDLSHLSQKTQYELFYLINGRRNLDQPMDMTSELYTMINYGGIVYSKTAVVFDYLKAYLGDELYDRCMQRYYDQWKFRHPYPTDLRQVLDSCTGRDLSWLFDDVIFTTKKIDYKIASCRQLKNSTDTADSGYIATIQNVGDIASPFSISAMRNDTILATQWFDGFTGTTQCTLNFPISDRLKIDAWRDIPEINRKNNTIRTSGIFRKVEPLKLQHFISLEHPDKTQIFWEIASGWNNYDKMMLGVALYSGLIPYRKLEYAFIPMYSLGTKTLAGSGKIGYTFFPMGSIFQNIHLGITGRRYAYRAWYNYYLGYAKVAPVLSINFKKQNSLGKIDNTLNIRQVFIMEDSFNGFNSTSGDISGHARYKNNYWVTDLSYSFSMSDHIFPKHLVFNMQLNEQFSKISGEARFSIKFPGKWKGASLRLFGGAFVYKDDVPYRFGFGLDGNSDYLYDQVFLGRSESYGWMAQQFSETDGGFKALMGIPLSRQWITAANLKVATFKKIPVKIFADAGYIPDYWHVLKEGGVGMGSFVWDAGIDIALIPDMLEIYIPLFVSTNWPTPFVSDVVENIRFTFNIGHIDPHRAFRSLQL